MRQERAREVVGTLMAAAWVVIGVMFWAGVIWVACAPF